MRRQLLYTTVMCALLACGNAADRTGDEYQEDGDAAVAPSSDEVTPAAREDDPPATARSTIVRRPAQITVTISGSPHHDGSFRASGASRMCGYMDDMLGQPTTNYTVQFPFEEQPSITDVTFNAEGVQGGSTNRYHLSVHVVRDGRQPPAFVVRAGQPGSTDTGTARVSVAGDTTRLNVIGQRSTGGNLEMTVVCTPAAE